MTQISNFPLQIQMSKNEFYVEIFENLWVNIKMYMIEVFKSKISDLKPQNMIILWTLKHVSAISEHPVFKNICMLKKSPSSTIPIPN